MLKFISRLKNSKNLIYIYSAIIGIFGALGILCMFTLITMATFKEAITRYPYAYPFSKIGGTMCFFIDFLSFIGWIIKLRNENRKLKVFCLSFAIVLLSFVIFIFVWSGFWQLVSNIIAENGF